jgi:uncharacterized lipoprotein
VVRLAVFAALVAANWAACQSVSKKERTFSAVHQATCFQ